MGKHERDWAEAAEIAVADGINGLPVDDSIAKVASAIRAHVATLYPGDAIEQAQWSGGDSYDDPGDVLIYLASDEIVNVELKFSHGKGSGTAKNPGSTFFNKRIDPGIQSYKQFDLPYQAQRWQYLSQHLGRPITRRAEYGRELRRIRDSANQGDAACQQVIDDIADIANQSQRAYAEYASLLLNQHLVAVNRVGTELLGLDDTGQVRQGVIYCVVKMFESARQTVEFYDYSEMDRVITKVVATGQSIKFLNQSGLDVFRFAVNWKNICQGGENPAFCVWVGRAYQ